MIVSPVGGLPGIRAARQAVNRLIFRDYQIAGEFSGGRILDGTLTRDQGNTGNVDVVRDGMMIGLVTATKKYAPSFIGQTNAAYTNGTATMTLTAGAATELARRVGSSGTFKIAGPPGAAGIVASETITYSAVSGTTVTITPSVNNYVSGSMIMPTDGSEDPLSFTYGSGYGLKVTDIDGNSQDQPLPELPIAGVIIAANVIFYPADTSLRAWLKGRYSEQGSGKWVWDDNFTT